MSTGRPGGLQSVPLVIDGVLYLAGTHNNVFAIDARTGRQIWRYQHEMPADVPPFTTRGVTRGLAVLGNKLFLGTLDAHMVALDIKTGKVVWDTLIEDYKKYFSATSAPLVITMVLGVVFPFIRPQMFGSSPAARYKLGSIPVMSIVSAVAAVFFAWALWLLWNDPIAAGHNPTVLITLGVTLALGIVLYVVMYTLRRRQGIRVAVDNRGRGPGTVERVGLINNGLRSTTEYTIRGLPSGFTPTSAPYTPPREIARARKGSSNRPSASSRSSGARYPWASRSVAARAPSTSAWRAWAGRCAAR